MNPSRTAARATLAIFVTITAFSLFLRPANLMAQEADAAEVAYNRGDYTTAFRQWKAVAVSLPKTRDESFNQALATLRVAHMMDSGQIRERRNYLEISVSKTYVSNLDTASVANRWRDAAERGSAGAQFWYGVASEALENRAEATKWYRQSAAQNFAPAQLALGKLYSDARLLEFNLAEAFSWYEKSAKQGEVAAMTALGDLYGHTCGKEYCQNPSAEDIKTSSGWYRKAAERGDAVGQYHVGAYYETQGVKNVPEAPRWYQKAADQGKAGGIGSADAALALGFIYRDGTGVPKDEDKAVAWFRTAIDLGEISGKLRLAQLYAKPSFHESTAAGRAAELFREIANSGPGDNSIAIAQEGLGTLYAQGRGVPQDYVLAHMWFNLAAAGNIFPVDGANAATARGRVAKQMTPEQIGRAQELARNWRPSGNSLTPPPTAVSHGDNPRSAIDRIRAGAYSDMPRIEESAGTVGGDGITLENGTDYPITVYFSGPENRSLALEAHQSVSLKLLPGSYEVGAETASGSVRPFYGKQSFRQGSSYRTRFYVGNVR
jgi:TPR repeat protein